MKSFTEYLTESVEEHKYAFKIKIAGDLPENCEEVMKRALEKYQVTKFAKTKTTPIQQKLLDFPEMENAQVHIFDIELDYPATSFILTRYIADETGIPLAQVRVRNPNEESESELNAENDDIDGVSLLNSPLEKDNHQSMVGDKGVANFLKELQKTRKEISTPYKGTNEAILAKKAHKDKANNMMKPGPARSPLGTVANPDPRKGKTK
jgi:hypothetical protein